MGYFSNGSEGDAYESRYCDRCGKLWLNGERLEFMTVDSALDGIKWAIDNIAAQCNAGMGE